MLVACDSKNSLVPDGDYTSIDGKNTVSFTSSGVVRARGKETTYTVEGNTLKYQFDGGMSMAFVLNPDGSISLNGVDKFKKSK